MFGTYGEMDFHLLVEVDIPRINGCDFVTLLL